MNVIMYTNNHFGLNWKVKGFEAIEYQSYYLSNLDKTTIADHDQSRFNKLIENRYAYTSREIEEELGDYYYRARYYSPDTGRFLSEDPIKFYGGDSNLYRYVNNRPLLFNDPAGKNPLIIGGAISGGLAGLFGGFYNSDSCTILGTLKDGITGGLVGIAGGILAGGAASAGNVAGVIKGVGVVIGSAAAGAGTEALGLFGSSSGLGANSTSSSNSGNNGEVCPEKCNDD